MSTGSESLYYSTSPRIARAGSDAELRIVPLHEHARFREAAAYEVTYTPMEDIGTYSSFSAARHKPPVRLRDGAMCVTQRFDGEQEHSLFVEEVTPAGRVPVGDFRVYSLRDDLYHRTPYKGDLHIHSNRSDGREAPGYVAASCRKIGMDFMALTDHRLYEPSIDAQRAFESVEIDLRIYPGEEVHPPSNPIHIVNFGGRRSVNRMFGEQAYQSEVDALAADLGPLPEGLDRSYLASSLWCFRKIREVGGLSIFCHPYWISERRYHIPGSLTTRLFDLMPFDAYELIGGYHLREAESNMLQVLRYQDELAKGRAVPIVGVSDAHGCDRGELFGWYYTIVFSPSPSLDDLAASIRGQYSVAVEHLPGTSPRVHGPLRLAKYAHFLLRELFGCHDALCREEGELMVAHVAATAAPRPETPAERLSALSGRAEAYWRSVRG